MKVIVTGAPVIGHLNPLFAAGRILAGLGHEVVGYAPSVFRSNVEANGMAFHALPPDADVDTRDLGKFMSFPLEEPPGDFTLLRIYWERLFVGHMREEYLGLRDLLRQFPADIILAENMSYATLPMLLGPRSRRPVIAHFGAVFLQLTRDDQAPMFSGLPPARTEDDRITYGKLAEEARQIWFDPVDALLSAMLAELGCPPLPLPFYDAMIKLPDLYLQTGVPGFELPRTALPSTLHYVGATQPAAGVDAIPDWAADLEDGRKVVLVTQGTAANSDLGQLIRPTLEALADERDLVVVATTGGRPVEILGTVPDNARIAQFLPYHWLMPKLDLLVTNGGYGSVNHALSLGIPLVVAGTTEDKKEVSARVTWSGVGLALGTDDPTVKQIGEAVRQVLGTASFRDRAVILAKEYQANALENKLGPLLEALVQDVRTATPKSA
ncbi:MAG: nucleotide disphospho-sugar-binding domain-containing protein [Rhodopila sp.]